MALQPRKPVQPCKPDPDRPRMRPVILRPETVAQVKAICAATGDPFDEVVHDAIALLADELGERFQPPPFQPVEIEGRFGPDGGGRDQGDKGQGGKGQGDLG